MFDFFMIIVVVIWNLLWFVCAPILLMKYLSKFPLIGKKISAAREYSKGVIFNDENYLLITLLIFGAMIFNYTYRGDIMGVLAPEVTMEEFRWSIGYFLFLVSGFISFTVFILIFFKLQIYVAFFLAASYIIPLNPNDFGSIVLWYFQYLVLSIPSLLVGYIVYKLFTKPVSNRIRNYVAGRSYLNILEFVLVNLFMIFLLYNLISKNINMNNESFIHVEFGVMLVGSVVVASIITYIKYKHKGEDLQLINTSSDVNPLL